MSCIHHPFAGPYLWHWRDTPAVVIVIFDILANVQIHL